MTSAEDNTISRRQLGKRITQVAAASALAGIAIPAVHAASDNALRVALVGCGGRGTGATMDALRATRGVTPRLHAMADAFKDRLDSSYRRLTGSGEFGERIDVPAERQFIGFEAYQHAIDSLKPGDVAIFATP